MKRKKTRADPIESVVSEAPIIIFGLDARGRFTLSTGRGLAALGLAPGEAAGRSALDIFKGNPRVLADLRRALKGEDFSSKEFVRGVWLETYYHPLFTAAGRLKAVVGFSLDVTARKRMETELMKSERRYRALIDTMQEGFCLVGRDGKHIFVNKALARICGVPHLSDLIGRSLLDHIAPEQRAALQARFEDALRTECFPAQVEATLVRKDGSRGVLELNPAPIYEEGRLAGACIVIRDITERRRAEEILRMTQFSMDNCSILIHWSTEDGRLIYVNDAACRALGYTRDELLKLNVHDLDPNRPASSWPQYWAECKRAGTLCVESLLRAKDGRVFPIEVTVNHMEFGDKEYHFVSILDISERKRAEAERARLLEVEMAARSEAESANRAKDQFLAIISHELRTPITAIMGWNWLLRSGELSPSERERAQEVIERNLQLEKQLIEDLLDISSLAGGRMTIMKRAVDLGPVTADAVAAFRPEAHAKRLDLICPPQAGLTVVGDPKRLRQIVSNLVSNAVKFTPEGGTVRVLARREGAQALITVEDTGPGFSAEFFPKIFDLFRQQDDSLTREYQGQGLGLAIVKHLAELHGGTVSVDPPAAGRGARLTVTLPLAAPGAVPDALSGAAASEKPAPGALSGLRVLLVEADADTRGMLASLLTQCGVEVKTAASADEAFATFTRRAPDVLLCDISMPDEDGYALMRRIRALPSKAGGQVPAAALTAFAGANDRVKALNVGFQIHLPKPVDPVELFTVVRALAGKRGTL